MTLVRSVVVALIFVTAISVVATSSWSRHEQSAFAVSSNLTAVPTPAETKVERDRRMKWWREARFGMFIHWGLYAVPAGEYKGKRSERIGEWIMEWANIPRAEYEKFAPQFNPVKFNAAEWVRIATQSSAGIEVAVSRTAPDVIASVVVLETGSKRR